MVFVNRSLFSGYAVRSPSTVYCGLHLNLYLSHIMACGSKLSDKSEFYSTQAEIIQIP